MKIRELNEKDLFNGFLDALGNMSDLEGIDSKTAKKIFNKIKRDPNHVVFVAEVNGEVVSTTTLFITQRFIHNAGLVGHIEDVATRKDHEGNGYASALQKKAIERAKQMGCYKVILNCDKNLIPFYEKFNYKESGVCMRLDLK